MISVCLVLVAYLLYSKFVNQIVTMNHLSRPDHRTYRYHLFIVLRSMPAFFKWILPSKQLHQEERRSSKVRCHRIAAPPAFVGRFPLPFWRRNYFAAPKSWRRNVRWTTCTRYPDSTDHAYVKCEPPIGSSDVPCNVDVVFKLLELVEQLLHPGPHLGCSVIFCVLVMNTLNRLVHTSNIKRGRLCKETSCIAEGHQLESV